VFTFFVRILAVKPRRQSWWVACFCAALAGGLATASPREASAQIVLVPVRNNAIELGPKRAEGVVIWSHGRSVEVEDSLAPTPGYVDVMSRAGWDAFRLNRMRSDDTLPRSGAALASHAERFKAAGYRRVVLAGHSFGGFISLIAAGQSDAIDAVIATAPAAFGSFESSYDTFRLNATELYALLGDVRRARVALAFFHGDTFDPGGRGERAGAILSARQLPHLLIDQPPRLVSHWASNTAEFTRRFAACFVDFAANDVPPRSDDCDAGSVARQVAGIPGGQARPSKPIPHPAR
jgi:pimeloyl-ACP methyl ester carboxylesterase